MEKKYCEDCKHFGYCKITGKISADVCNGYAESSGTIFGLSWEQIQKKQQGGKVKKCS
jgi:hypothetical protein